MSTPTTCVTIDIVARHSAGDGGWAWVHPDGRRKARWMNTTDAQQLYREAMRSAREDLARHDVLTVRVRNDADLATVQALKPKKVNVQLAKVGDDTIEQARRLAQRAMTTGAGHTYDGPRLNGPVRISCDGSYDANTGVGGWAWYLDDEVYACDAVTSAASSTQMEYLAALEALRHVGDGAEVIVLSDCKIMVEAVHGREDGKMPKMRGDLARLTDQLRAEVARVRGSVQWVPSHSGVEGNTQADRAARGVVRSTML